MKISPSSTIELTNSRAFGCVSLIANYKVENKLNILLTLTMMSKVKL